MIAISKKVHSFFLTFALLSYTAAYAQETTETEFVRISVDDQGQPLALQLAIVSYVPRHGDSKVRVDLVGAIHIGDTEYYEDLNDRFKDMFRRRMRTLMDELLAPPLLDDRIDASPLTRRDTAISASVGILFRFTGHR